MTTPNALRPEGGKGVLKVLPFIRVDFWFSAEEKKVTGFAAHKRWPFGKVLLCFAFTYLGQSEVSVASLKKEQKGTHFPALRSLQCSLSVNTHIELQHQNHNRQH